MYGVRVVSRYKEARRNAHQVLLFRSAHCAANAMKCVLEEGASRSLLRAGADFFVVKDTVYSHGILG